MLKTWKSKNDRQYTNKPYLLIKIKNERVWIDSKSERTVNQALKRKEKSVPKFFRAINYN
jgi:hypothetical protein